MKLRDNVVLHYTLVTLLVTVTVSAGLGWVLSRQATDHLIRSHIDFFPAAVGALTDHHQTVYDFFRAPAGTPLPPEVENFFGKIMSFGAVFRLKAWGTDGTVLWSDRPELIGQSFADNEELREAVGGKVVYEVEEQHGSESVTEQDAGKVLEIYVPLMHDGRCMGVLELYESDRALFLQIARNTSVIWVWVVVAGAVLYALLFLVFYRSYRRQKQISAELAQTQEATIFALAYQAELRDVGTGRHLERTSRYVRILAEELRTEPEFRSYVTEDYIDNLAKSAPLHDIGKVGIADAILCKPGRLSQAEFREMQQHAGLGAAILEKAEEKLPFRSFLRLARHIALYHHERWDGEGYPFGLRGEEIPLSARLMALADVYDALRSRRHYKEALPHEVCVAIIWEESGHQFDPRIVDAFLRRAEEFRFISTAPSPRLASDMDEEAIGAPAAAEA